jgi:hypothetical protein
MLIRLFRARVPGAPGRMVLVDHRLRAGLEGGAVVVLTIIVATIVAHLQDHLIDPTSVTVVGPPGPGDDSVTFVVRGAGCPAPPDARDRGGHHIKSPAKRVNRPDLQYTTNTVNVHFHIQDPGKWRCTGDDPGVRYQVHLIVPIGDRVLRDGDRKPPQPMAVEPTQ